MRYSKILEKINNAGSELKTIRIFYPKTENTLEGWREVEPYSFRTSSGKNRKKLKYGIDQIKPENIFYGYTVDSGDMHCDAFKIGKIKKAERTNNSFVCREGWDVEF